jgi:hypothetical protein
MEQEPDEFIEISKREKLKLVKANKSLRDENKVLKKELGRLNKTIADNGFSEANSSSLPLCLIKHVISEDNQWFKDAGEKLTDKLKSQDIIWAQLQPATGIRKLSQCYFEGRSHDFEDIKLPSVYDTIEKDTRRYMSPQGLGSDALLSSVISQGYCSLVQPYELVTRQRDWGKFDASDEDNFWKNAAATPFPIASQCFEVAKGADAWSKCSFDVKLLRNALAHNNFIPLGEGVVLFYNQKKPSEELKANWALMVKLDRLSTYFDQLNDTFVLSMERDIWKIDRPSPCTFCGIVIGKRENGKCEACSLRFSSDNPDPTPLIITAVPVAKEKPVV